MSKGKNQYVVPTQSGWGVKGEGNSKLTTKTDTKADALKIGKEIGKNQQSQLTILPYWVKMVKFKIKIVTEMTHFRQRIINIKL